MNSVILVGRLTRDVEVSVSGDTKVARFGIAVDRRFKKDGETDADFINCVAFNKRAEFLEKYFKKGMKIGVQGEWRTGSYTNKDGQKVYTNDCLISECEFVESKNASNTEASNNAPQVDDSGFMQVDEAMKDDMPF